jgi:glycosyltransferase involved in cell wall biosynthesis
VVVAQGTDINDYLRYPLRRGIILRHLGRAAAVVTRSEALRRCLLAAGLPDTRVRTICNGVDTDLFRPAADRAALRRELGLNEADVAVLFVGNLLPVKNPVLAVEALAVLKERFPARHWRLLMVGAGPLRAKILERAGSLGDAVTLAGVCPPAQVVRFMQAADVLCVPSHNEGIPNVIREALACGLPVAATRVGGIPEVLTDPRVGELVEPGQPTAMAEALARMVACGPQGEVCRRQALAFSWDETVRRYLDLFAEVQSS